MGINKGQRTEVKKYGGFGKHHLLTFSSRTNHSFAKINLCTYPPPLLLEKIFYGV